MVLISMSFIMSEIEHFRTLKDNFYDNMSFAHSSVVLLVFFLLICKKFFIRAPGWRSWLSVCIQCWT